LEDKKTITAKIKWVIYNKDTFFILDLDDGNKAKGHIFNTGKSKLIGLIYEFTGRFVTDKYGKTFNFDDAKLKTDEMYFFLTSVVKGVGDKKAYRILDRFGDDTARVISESPEKLSSVPGIGEKRIETIVSSYKKFSHIRELSEYLSPYGFTSLMVNEIFNLYSHQSIPVIEENPYRLCEIKGISFKLVDGMALQKGTPLISGNRIKSGLTFFLKKRSFKSGNIWEHINEIFYGILRQLSLDEDNIPMIKEIIEKDEEFYFDEENGIIALSELRDQEIFIREFIHNKTKEPLNISEKITDSEICSFSDIELSQKQKDAIKNACSFYISAICGYAGTGKTTVCKVVMNLLKKYWSKRVVGCAMSGIAARRLEEISGFSCYTIHSLLGFDGEDFRHNEDNRLEYDVIILDEAGMVNSYLFYSLIRALHDSCILIIIGDDAQLPPIGPGNVFSDILASDLVPFERLTRVFRRDEDSVINLFASRIRAGKIPGGYTDIHSDWYFSMCNNDLYGILDDTILDRVIAVAEKFVHENNKADPITGIQILTPMKKGPLGTHELNKRLKEIINPPVDKKSFKKGAVFYSEGDKVIHLRNIERKTFEEDDYLFGEDFSRLERIFNGSIGIIEKIDLHENKVFVRMYTKEVVQYETGEFGDIIDHAFALTVHKAQGSEFDRVIIPITKSHAFMLDNQWLYTALTRAKRGIVFIGENRAFEHAATNIGRKKRKTFLNIDVDTLLR